MSTISDLAYYVRSKNAGRFWVTIDIFCQEEEAYRRLAASEKLNGQAIGARFGVNPEYVKLFRVDDLKVIKISYPRASPQGGKDERDMHAGQQYIQLLDMEV